MPLVGAPEGRHSTTHRHRTAKTPVAPRRPIIFGCIDTSLSKGIPQGMALGDSFYR